MKPDLTASRKLFWLLNVMRPEPDEEKMRLLNLKIRLPQYPIINEAFNKQLWDEVVLIARIMNVKDGNSWKELQSWLFWISHKLNLITVLMRLNKYLFNRVNNKERERGQRSVVWLKRGQPCLHHLHVLSTVFSWRPFSSFSLWIILLPPSLPPLILPLLNQCDGCLVPLAWGPHGWRARVCQPWGRNSV